MIAKTTTFAVGSFTDSTRAKEAMNGLFRAGFRQDQIALVSRKSGTFPDVIQEASDAGETLVVVEAENRCRAAELILERNGSTNPYFDECHLEDEGPRLVGYPFSWEAERN